MTSTNTSDFPAQVTLPGQAATVEGPLDMTMMYVMHHAFRRDLTGIFEAAAGTPVEAAETWRALDRRWRLFGYALHHHHTGEDNGYWPLLTERATDAERAVLRAMAEEHHAIDPLLEECGALFARLVEQATAAGRAQLVTVLERSLWHLDGHLAHEETEAIPLLQKYLTPAEDERIEKEHFRDGVPFRMVAALVPWAMHEAPDEVRRAVFTAAGPIYRLIWLFNRRRFVREDRLAMRYR